MYLMCVAVDGSEHAMSAVRHAIEMAQRINDAHVVLVNVQPPAMSGEVSNLLSADEVMAQHTERAEAVLAGPRALLEAARVDYETEIAIGTPADSIVASAANRNCDLIVVGASSHGRMHTLVLGSVASKIIRSAECPVTVVK